MSREVGWSLALLPSRSCPQDQLFHLEALRRGSVGALGASGEVVLRLLRGESTESLSRELGVPTFTAVIGLFW
jgi:hypothetical protein